MSETDQPKPKGVTRHLNIHNLPAAAAPKVDTRPLEAIVPWVIEFRVVGTPSVIQVRVKEIITIGRGDPDKPEKPVVDLEPYNAYRLGVSRQHAKIITRHNRVAVQDLGSSNGTFLNDGRLEPGGHYRLRHSDRLKLGQIELQVLFVVVPNIEDSDKEGEAVIPNGEQPVGEVPVIGSGQRVMVVEDDTHVAQTVQDVLTKIGFEVTVVNNVTDALFMLAESLPHAIVTELMMPDKSALDLIYYVRSREDGKELPLVVVSNASSGVRMNQAVEAGVDLFLKKPFGIDEFVQGINQIVPKMRK